VGEERSEKGLAGDFVLDAGALIGIERGDPASIAVLAEVVAVNGRVVIPASVLAQAWRGGSRSAVLARLVNASEVDPLSEDRAKEVGVRLGLRAARDVSDAHVVCCASEARAAVVTSDPDDIRMLADPGDLTLIEV